MKRIIFSVLILLVVAFGIYYLFFDNKSEAKKSKYLTKIEFSDIFLKVKVEDDNFDDKTLEAGNYKFLNTYAGDDKNGDERVYDLFLSSNDYTSADQMINGELEGTVGGSGFKEAVIELKKGQYLYIVQLGEPNQYGTVGNLLIEKTTKQVGVKN